MNFGDDISSNSTIKNWEKLNKSLETGYILSKRANKRMSVRKIIPKEYLSVPENLSAFESILKKIIEKDDINCIIFSLCINRLKYFNMVKITGNSVVSNDLKAERFLDEYKISIDFELIDAEFPENEKDPVGMVYQCLLTEGEKNIHGSYFTPQAIVNDFTSVEQKNVKVLDPCCGTAGMLMSVSGVAPENLYGIEKDPLTAMIAKCNLIIHFKDSQFYPNILCADFISGRNLFRQKFEYIITNPPWGAQLRQEDIPGHAIVKSKESFSVCLLNACRMIKKNGIIRFVLPESILSVRRHADIRRYILENLKIEKIKFYGKCFSGVYSDVIGIFLKKEENRNNQVLIEKNSRTHSVDQEFYGRFAGFPFLCCTQHDVRILDRLLSVPHTTLKDSRWGLGIVTGDNQKKLSEEKKDSFERIYTGKEVEKYFLKSPKYYISFDKNSFQQSAPESLYRVPEKLVYRFISKKLVFAADTSGSLVLNSANILIPEIVNMSIYSVLAYLNSEVFEYINMMWFNQLKVLKSNLLQLPFPYITAEEDIALTALAKRASRSRTAHRRIQEIIYSSFSLDMKSVMHIKEKLDKG